MSLYEFKPEEYPDDATVTGWADGVDVVFGAEAVAEPSAGMRVLGCYTVNNGDTYDLVILAVGPAGTYLTLPTLGEGQLVSVVVTSADDLANPLTLLGQNATYSVGPLLESADPSDAAYAIWTWTGLDPSDVFPFLEDIPIRLEITEGREFNCECDEETTNETLGALRTRMLVRLGYAAQAEDPPPGMALLLNDFLVSAQRILYRKYPALRTERFFTWTMQAGERFYDLPDNDEACNKRLDPYKLTWVGVEDPNGAWLPLIKGIPPTFYTGVMNPGIPERYEIRQCIEVFPAPIDGYKLRIKGHFGLTSFAEDEDQTTIDSELVFQWALATAKAHYGQPDAAELKRDAKTYLCDLVSGSHQTARYVPASWPIPPAVRPLFLPLGS